MGISKTSSNKYYEINDINNNENCIKIWPPSSTTTTQKRLLRPNSSHADIMVWILKSLLLRPTAPKPSPKHHHPQNHHTLLHPSDKVEFPVSGWDDRLQGNVRGREGEGDSEEELAVHKKGLCGVLSVWQLLLDLPDETDRHPLFKLIEWCVQVQDFDDLVWEGWCGGEKGCGRKNVEIVVIN